MTFLNLQGKLFKGFLINELLIKLIHNTKKTLIIKNDSDQ